MPIFDEYHEKGHLKFISNRFRQGSQIVDMLPGFLLFPGLDDMGAAGLTMVACVIDTLACLAQGDKKTAKSEFLKGLAEAAVVALPGVEYLNVLGGQPRRFARRMVGRWLGEEFNEASGAAEAGAGATLKQTEKGPRVPRPGGPAT